MTPREQAVSFFNQAVSVQESEKQLSYKFLVSAAEADPTLNNSWYGIANANADMGLRESAIACYRRYLELNPSDGKGWTNFGHMLYHTGRIDEAEAACLRAIKIDDELANAWMNLSLVQSVQCKVTDSVRSAKRGYDLEPNPITEMALGFAYLHARQLDLGFKHFEAKIPYKIPQYLSFPWPRWQGEEIADKTLYVVSDQGLGDTLCFLRFLPAVAQRCEKIIFHAQSELMRMAALMLMDSPNIEIIPLNSPLPVADLWVAITSLPVALGLSSDEIENTPQLPITIEPSLAPWKVPERKLHVGICWTGSAGNDIDRWRSTTIENFLELCRVPGVQLYSLQVGAHSQEVHASGSAAVVKDLTPWIRDVYDTATILQNLDLVISIESFLPHLCATVGKECWIAYARNGGDYRVGRKGQRTIWHPTARIFYQDETASWQTVFNDIVSALREKIG